MLALVASVLNLAARTWALLLATRSNSPAPKCRPTPTANTKQPERLSTLAGLRELSRDLPPDKTTTTLARLLERRLNRYGVRPRAFPRFVAPPRYLNLSMDRKVLLNLRLPRNLKITLG